MNTTGKTLAFCTDSGSVGVVDLVSRRVRRMKTRHGNVGTIHSDTLCTSNTLQICGSVSFIPNRHNELVSGGYDSALLHFDFKQGTLLSRFDIGSPVFNKQV